MLSYPTRTCGGCLGVLRRTNPEASRAELLQRPTPCHLVLESRRGRPAARTVTQHALPYGLGALRPALGRGRGRAAAGPGRARRARPRPAAGLPGAGGLPEQPAVRDGRHRAPGHVCQDVPGVRVLSTGPQVLIPVYGASTIAAHWVSPPRASRLVDSGKLATALPGRRRRGRLVSGHQVLNDPDGVLDTEPAPGPGAAPAPRAGRARGDRPGRARAGGL
jgi:hypothetical protein